MCSVMSGISWVGSCSGFVTRPQQLLAADCSRSNSSKSRSQLRLNCRGVRAFRGSPMAQHVVVVAGRSSVRSTVGKLLAEELRCQFYDADGFHSVESKAKMSSGIPLTDEDRWPWLDRLALALLKEADEGRSCVLACSALKESYRVVLAKALQQHLSLKLTFVLLDPSTEELERRLQARAKGGHHFMPPSLLASQLQTLERDDTLITCREGTPRDIVQQIMQWIQESHAT